MGCGVGASSLATQRLRVSLRRPFAETDYRRFVSAMRSLSLWFLFLAAGIGGHLSAAPAAEPSARRGLVITAPAVTDEAYRAQAAILLPGWAGLLERDFVVTTRFDAGAAFSVALIGKDGGEKARRAQPISSEELFALVDAMPMRRAEMRARP